VHLHAVTDNHLRALPPYEPEASAAHPHRHTVHSARPTNSPVAVPERPAQRPVPRTDRQAGQEIRLVHGTLTAIMEAFSGTRPVTQVGRLLSPPLHRRFSARRIRPGRYGRFRPVRIHRPAPGIVEATGLVDAGARVVAVAARLERGEQDWRCTRFDVLEAGAPPGRESARAS
jgi:hypothetical protein